MSGVTAIRDHQGRLLGYFVPVSPYDDELYLEATSTVDPQELARRAKDPSPRRTTQQVLERLKSSEQ